MLCVLRGWTSCRDSLRNQTMVNVQHHVFLLSSACRLLTPPLISCIPKLLNSYKGGLNEYGNPSGVLSLVYAAVQLIEEVTRNKQLQRWHAVMAAWQRVLPEMYPSMKVSFLIRAHTCSNDDFAVQMTQCVASMQCQRLLHIYVALTPVSHVAG